MRRHFKGCLILTAALFTLGCRSTSFPGFTRVTPTSQYFINRAGVQIDSQGDHDVVSFVMIALHSDGSHQMLQMETDCSSRMFNNGGTRYQKDGQMLGSIEADHQFSPLNGSDLSKAAFEACRAAREKQAFSGAFDARKALTALFGNYSPGTKSSSVTVHRAEEFTNTDGTAGPNATGKLTVVLDSPFTQRGAAKRLLVTATTVEGEECHACPARIGAFLFANVAGYWTPEIVDKEALRFGSMGQAGGDPGTAQVVKFAPDVYGFSLVNSTFYEGNEGISEELVAPVRNHYRSVLSMSAGGNDSGNCGDQPEEFRGKLGFNSGPCTGTKVTVRFPGSVHGFLDIETSEIGTEENNGSVVQVNRRRLYIFSGDKYVEQAAAH